MAFDWQSFIGSNIGEIFKEIVGTFKTDPTVAMQVQAKLAEAQIELQGKLIDQITAQLAVNQAEASNTNMFVAGWRPFIGWVCGIGLGVQFLLNPVVTWVATLSGHPVAFPSLDLGTLMTLLFGMLGLGAMRSYEKVSAAPGAAGLK